VHGDAAELEEAREDFHPRARRGVEDRDEREEAEDHADLEPHDRLQRVVDLPAEDERHEHAEEHEVFQRLEQREPGERDAQHGVGL
jgi:hypothetical protein